MRSEVRVRLPQSPGSVLRRAVELRWGRQHPHQRRRRRCSSRAGRRSGWSCCFDDFQIDSGSEPNEIGLGVSATAVNPLRPDASLVGLSPTPWSPTGPTATGSTLIASFTRRGDGLCRWDLTPTGWRCGPQPALRAAIRARSAYTRERRGEGRVEDPPGRTRPEPEISLGHGGVNPHAQRRGVVAAVAGAAGRGRRRVVEGRQRRQPRGRRPRRCCGWC